jgi:hypothetical protein
LRKVLNADEFAGGMMHRFLIVHEREPIRTKKAMRPDPRVILKLAQELRELRDGAPDEMVLGDKARMFIDRLDRQQKWFKAHQLAGFWGRFADLTMKVAQIYALAQGKHEITMEEVDRAETLMRFRLAPLLTGLVEELDAPDELKKLLDLADSLETTGPQGWTKTEFFRRTGKTEGKRQVEMLDSMVHMGLAWLKTGMVYGRAEWQPATELEEELEPDLTDDVDEDGKSRSD